jgi:hypothetical protein
MILAGDNLEVREQNPVAVPTLSTTDLTLTGLGPNGLRHGTSFIWTVALFLELRSRSYYWYSFVASVICNFLL